MIPNKKIKTNTQPQQQRFQQIYNMIMKAGNSYNTHNLLPILKSHLQQKHPILHVLHPQNQVYKTNPDKKKKPLETYLDTVNAIYRKKDLDVLVNPLYTPSIFEKWAPLEIAIFQQGILKFGKQFEFLSQLIKTKSPKDVYEFYLEWKTSTHYKSYKSAQFVGNRVNYQEWI